MEVAPSDGNVRVGFSGLSKARLWLDGSVGLFLFLGAILEVWICVVKAP